jgi:hypothetical protein
VSPIAIDGLRRCKKCQTLYDDRARGKSFCPADGQRHEPGKFDYQLQFGIAEQSTQSDWRRCQHCQAIFFNGYAHGRCPSDPGAKQPHVADPAQDFHVPYGRAENDHVQAGWEFCVKCNVLFYSGSTTPNATHCTAGGEHEANPDGLHFTLVHGLPLPVLIDNGPEQNPI